MPRQCAARRRTLSVAFLSTLPAALFIAWQKTFDVSFAQLGLAIAVKRIAPALTVATLVGVAALGWRLWRSSSIWLRTGIVIAVVLSAASAVMVRQNYFEWMFNPITAAGFVPAGDARLSDKEMVMAVRIGQEARAYPIVQMAYHHILNDTVATVPIVVTY